MTVSHAMARETLGTQLLQLLHTLLAAVLLSSIPAQCCFKRLVYHGRYPLLYVDNCVSTFDLGRLVGSTFSGPIKERMAASISFQKAKVHYIHS